MGVSGNIILTGSEDDSLEWTELHCPVHFYEANVSAQAILSYSWLASQNLVINPRRHGLGFSDDSTRLFIPGMRRDELRRPPKRPSIYLVKAYKLATRIVKQLSATQYIEEIEEIDMESQEKNSGSEESDSTIQTKGKEKRFGEPGKPASTQDCPMRKLRSPLPPRLIRRAHPPSPTFQLPPVHPPQLCLNHPRRRHPHHGYPLGRKHNPESLFKPSNPPRQ
jgi:hypothetical protein